MAVHQIDMHNYDEMVIRSDQPVLLDFYAPWCGPCSLLSPVLDEIAGERPDIKVCKVNVDTNSELTSLYKVYRIPTLLVMQEGKEKERIVGARPKAQLLELFV